MFVYGLWTIIKREIERPFEVQRGRESERGVYRAKGGEISIPISFLRVICVLSLLSDRWWAFFQGFLLAKQGIDERKVPL